MPPAWRQLLFGFLPGFHAFAACSRSYKLSPKENMGVSSLLLLGLLAAAGEGAAFGSHDRGPAFACNSYCADFDRQGYPKAAVHCVLG